MSGALEKPSLERRFQRLDGSHPWSSMGRERERDREREREGGKKRERKKRERKKKDVVACMFTTAGLELTTSHESGGARLTGAVLHPATPVGLPSAALPALPSGGRCCPLSAQPRRWPHSSSSSSSSQARRCLLLQGLSQAPSLQAWLRGCPLQSLLSPSSSSQVHRHGIAPRRFVQPSQPSQKWLQAAMPMPWFQKQIQRVKTRHGTSWKRDGNSWNDDCKLKGSPPRNETHHQTLVTCGNLRLLSFSKGRARHTSGSGGGHKGHKWCPQPGRA